MPEVKLMNFSRAAQRDSSIELSSARIALKSKTMTGEGPAVGRSDQGLETGEKNADDAQAIFLCIFSFQFR